MLGRVLHAAAAVGFGASALLHLASFTPLAERIAQQTDIFAFIFNELGVEFSGN